MVLGPGVVAANLEAQRWRRVLPRVYATFTGPLIREARITGALLYGGPAAVLSHTTAAEEWRMLALDPLAPVHITVPYGCSAVSQPPHVVVHRSRDFPCGGADQAQQNRRQPGDRLHHRTVVRLAPPGWPKSPPTTSPTPTAPSPSAPTPGPSAPSTPDTPWSSTKSSGPPSVSAPPTANSTPPSPWNWPRPDTSPGAWNIVATLGTHQTGPYQPGDRFWRSPPKRKVTECGW